jgi:hypothetical protein
MSVDDDDMVLSPPFESAMTFQPVAVGIHVAWMLSDRTGAGPV